MGRRRGSVLCLAHVDVVAVVRAIAGRCGSHVWLNVTRTAATGHVLMATDPVGRAITRWSWHLRTGTISAGTCWHNRWYCCCRGRRSTRAEHRYIHADKSSLSNVVHQGVGGGRKGGILCNWCLSSVIHTAVLTFNADHSVIASILHVFVCDESFLTKVKS